jgi:hypothetical protein
MNEFSKYRIEMNNITADASPARKSTIDPPGYSASLAKDSVSIEITVHFPTEKKKIVSYC